MVRKTIKTILFSLGILTISGVSVLAGFGVSPTNIYNERLKPGSHFEKSITLSRSDPSEELEIVIEPALGEIESWFQYDKGLKFAFPKGERRTTFNVIVDIPESATYRNFEGVIRVRAINKNGDVKGVSIVKGARLDVNLVTTEENVSELLIRSLKMLDSVDGEPLKLEIIAENKGNVEVSPDAKIIIKDLQMEELEVVEYNDIEAVAPNTTKTVYAEFATTLPEGEYFVEAQVLLEDKVLRSERLVFRIVGERSVEEVTSDVFADVLSFVKENWISIGIGIIALVLVYILLTVLWKIEKMKEIKESKWSILFGSIVLSRIVISIIIAILFVFLSSYLVKKFSSTSDFVEEEVVAQKEEPEVEPTEVMGVGTVNRGFLPLDPTVVNIRDEGGKVKYPIYVEADYDSEIIYYASEDESFSVIEERANWYRVSIDNGLDGWLDKSMVKNIVSEER